MAKKVIRSDIRVNKYISDSGFCSRREADKMIADERVTINGELATLGSRVAELRPNRRSKNSMVKKSDEAPHQGRKSKTYTPKKVVKEGEEKSKNRARTKLVPGKASSGNVKKKIK